MPETDESSIEQPAQHSEPLQLEPLQLEPLSSQALRSSVQAACKDSDLALAVL